MSDSDHGQRHGLRRPGQTAQQGADGTSIELEEAASRIARRLLKQPTKAKEQPPLMLAGRRLWTLVEASRTIAHMDGFGIQLHALLTRVQIAAQEGRFTLRDPQNGAVRASCWSSAVLSAYLYAEDFNRWLDSAGYLAEFRLPADADETGSPVSVIRGDAMTSAPTSRHQDRAALRHSTRDRRENLLTPIIGKAQELAGPGATVAQVWAELQRMATSSSPPAPLCGADTRGVLYLKDGKTAALTRDALRDRITRARARDSAR